MLHDVSLPLSSCRALTEATFWQFRLLRWAAEQDEADREACQEWLANQPRYSKQAAGVTTWIWAAQARRESIEAFARDRSVDHATKRQWLYERWDEARRLRWLPQGTIEHIGYRRQDNTPAWQKNAAAFWLTFYQGFRSDTGLPSAFFRNTDSNYTAQEFLKAFLQENNKLCVCPICDSTSYFTIIRRKEEASIYTDIDHFFPKENYPHLSIHPYNLVPLCHNCNSGSKGSEDPLEAKDAPPHQLQHIWLPYRREKGLQANLVIALQEVEIKVVGEDGFKQNYALTVSFAATHQHTLPYDADALSEILDRVYDLPGRWQSRIDEIGEKLFRRMREYLRFYNIEQEDTRAEEYLNELLYILNQEDAAREPYSIAMTWWLAHLLNSEINLATPLMQEIDDWREQQKEQITMMRKHGADLRALLQTAPAAQHSHSTNDPN